MVRVSRRERAHRIAANGWIERDYDGFKVFDEGQEFFVREVDGRRLCSCAQSEDQACEHVLAVEFYLESAEAKSEVAEFARLLSELSQPIPPELRRRRVGWTDESGRQHEVDYVEWHTVADLLDRVCPDWSHRIVDIKQIGDLVAVTASITIRGVTRQGIGTGSAYDEKGIKKAEHDALKRAAVKFGVARELYRRDEEYKDEEVRLPEDSTAKSMADLVTPRQLVAIRAVANAQGVDAESECVRLLGCKPEELSRRAASAFIDHLKSLERRGARRAG